jgi:hypothetical protein
MNYMPWRKAIYVTTAIIGGIVLVIQALCLTGFGFHTTLNGSVGVPAKHLSDSTEAHGDISELEIAVKGHASLEVKFGDTESAKLEASSSSARGSLDLDDGVLTVSALGPKRALISTRGTRYTLTLPERFNDGSLNMEVEQEVGLFDAAGHFRSVSIDGSAGKIAVNGSAQDLEVNAEAAQADINLEDVYSAQLSVSVGELNATFTGERPKQIFTSVETGSMNLTVPDGDYAVDVKAELGELKNNLDITASSTHRIRGSVEMGELTLDSGANG